MDVYSLYDWIRFCSQGQNATSATVLFVTSEKQNGSDPKGILLKASQQNPS